MRRAIDGTGGLDLHFAVIGAFVVGMGSVECGCADERWCHRPVLSTLPLGHGCPTAR